jgi:hypothetical protein
MLSAEEAAAVQANLLSVLAAGDKGAFEAKLGVDMRAIANCIGPGGVFDTRGIESKESPNAVRVVDMMLGASDRAPKGSSPAADPVDVVQQALDKAGGGKVIPVDFVPKNKED